LAEKSIEEWSFVDQVSRKLRLVEEIKSLDLTAMSDNDPESSKIALNLVHICNSSLNIKKSLDEITVSEVEKVKDILIDISTEIRHIQWHLHNMEYFGPDDFN
jgi:hypothetical protein